MARSSWLLRYAASGAVAAFLMAVPPLAAWHADAWPATPVVHSQGPDFGTRSIGQVEVSLSATGGDGVNYAWSVVAGALPPGISIRTDFPTCCFPGTASAGLIGVATTPGIYNFTLRVTSGIEQADQASTMKITALTAKDSNLPDAFLGTAYSFTVTALGNAGAVTFTPTGAMPAGMSLSGAGVLSGTPTVAANNFNIPYSLTDGTDTINRNLNLTMSAIDVAVVGALAPGVLPNATQTVAYNQSVSASGGSGGYTYTANGLPQGLNINGATGAITGTISSSSFNIGKFSVSVTAKDSLNVSYQKRLSLTVLGAAAVLPAVAPSGGYFDDCTIGVGCSRTVQVQSGGVAPFAWVVSGLPPGMSLRTGSGVISSSITPGDAEVWGTPTATGVFNVEATVTDAAGATATNTFPLRVSTLLETNTMNLGGNGVIDNAYSRTLRVIGGTLPYSAAQTGGSLSAGLNLDGGTLVVSGTPTESGGFNPLFTFTDAGGPAQTLQTTNFYNINSAGSGAISINTSANLGSTTTGQNYSNTLSASGAGGFTWTTIGGTLPTGVALSSGGTLSGPASVSGIYTFLVKATDNGNAANFAVRQFTLNVTPMSISTTSPLTYGNVGTVYNQALSAAGGTGALTWTLNPFNYLPPGLSLAANGTISGTPTAKGQYNFSVTVADTASHVRSTSFSLSIYGPGEAPPVSQTQSSNFGTRSIGQVELELRATGGNGAYVWSLQSGALPPGISIRTDKPTSFNVLASAGLIGVATTPGTYNFTLRVSSGGQTFDQASSLKITALTVKDQSTLPDAFTGTFYSYTLTAIGNGGPVTFTPTGSMPAGMSLSAAGVLSGTPTTPATNFNISYSLGDGTDTVNRSVSLTMSAISVSATGVIAPGVLPNVTQNVAYSATLTASGGAGGYTYTISGLPNGLSLNGNTGVISGTVVNTNSNPGKVQLSVTAKDSLNVSYTKSMSLTVVAPVVGLPGVAPSGSSFDGCTFGVSCSRNVTVQSGGVAPFAWSASGLPPGMSLRTGSGVTSNNTTPGDAELWGAPTAIGLYNVEVTVTDAGGRMATNTFPLRVSTLLQTTSLSQGGNGAINTPFNRTLRVIGGTLPYTVAQVSGLMSAGVTLNSTTLVASGTPTESGQFSPRLVYTDAGGPAQTLQSTNNYTINSAGTGININSQANLGSAFLGAFYSNTLFASGAASITWTVMGGALPNGLSLGSNGFLSGTPTVAGVFTFLVQATDTNNSASFGARQFTINVTPISFSFPSPLPYGNVGTAYNQVLTANGGTGALTWTLVDFNYLPPGLALASNGTLSGTPTQTGLFSFSVMVADTANHDRTATVSLSIYPNGVVPPVGQTQAADFGTRSIGYLEFPLSAAGGNGNFTWSLESGALPPGMAIRADKPNFFPGNASAGLSGVATTPGNYNFTLRVSSGGQTSDQASTLRITALTVKDLNNVPDAFAGNAYSYTLTALGNAGAVTWTPTGGMPAGMSLSAAGVLSGTPTSVGTTNINFTLSDGTDTVSRSVTITVQPIRILILGGTAPGVFPNATQDAPYSATVSATGGSGGYTFTAQDLPYGLTLNPTTGVVSGTAPSGLQTDAAGPGNFTVEVTVTDSNAASTMVRMALDVIGSSPRLPVIDPFGRPWEDCTIGMTCDRAAEVTYGGVAPYTWTVSGLPAGMSYRSGDGVTNSYYTPGVVQLWGTPTVSGLFNITLTVMDSTGATTTNTYPLYVSELTQTNFLPEGALNQPYARTIRIVGGTLPYGSATQTNVRWPLGVSLNLNTFVVSGTPTESGENFSSLVTFTDGGGKTFRVSEYLRINAAGNGSVQLEDVGHPYLTVGVPVSGYFGCCASPLVVQVISGTAPPGINIASDGAVTGTPTTPGLYVFTLQATDGQNAANFAVRQHTLTVTPLFQANPFLPYGNVGTPYPHSLTVSGGTGALTFTLLPFNDLPPGLTLNANGSFSGTPTASGQYIFQFSVTDEGGYTLETDAAISIYPAGVGEAPIINGQPSSPTIKVGEDATFNVTASGVPVPTFRWQVSTDGGSTYQDLTNVAPYSGVTTDTLMITGATAGMNGYRYRAIATNGFGYDTSNVAILSVKLDVLVDLNGDGGGDAFLYNALTGAWSRQISQPGGGFVEEGTGSWDPGWSVLPANFNGDGLTDFFLYNTTSGQWFKMLTQPVGFTVEASGGWWPGWERYRLELNGDGITDFFLYDPATGIWFKCISTVSGFDYVQGGWNPGWEIYPMRLNADAYGDLFLINRQTGRWFWVLGENGPGFTYPVTDVWFAGWQFYPGDYNGDGLTDILLHDSATGIYFVARTNGAGFTYVQGGWSLGWHPYPMDLNGDGMDDLFLHDPDTGVWFQMISDGLGNFTNVGGEIWSLGWNLYPTDFNNDGRGDILLYHPTTGVWYQARNFVPGSFSYNSGTWAPGLTIVTRAPVR